MPAMHAANPSHRERRDRYRRLPLIDLMRLIAYGSDREALRELHENRTAFREASGRRVRLVEYLAHLRVTARTDCGRTIATTLTDEATDLTLDKFLNMPRPLEDTVVPGRALQHVGPDCRCYYKACVENVAKTTADATVTPIEMEALSAVQLQNLVSRHFWLSYRECLRRRNPLDSRYAWSVRGGTLSVSLPVSLHGSQRRAWLEANVEAPDASRTGERGRVQEIIDARLGRPRVISLDDASLEATPFARETSTEVGASNGQPWDLAGVVAREKVALIDHLAPTIRGLGPAALEALIRDIFRRAAEKDCSEAELARRYGLSKATFSRFAGGRWQEDPQRKIPVLWANTASVVRMHPAFAEAAQSAGVWPLVCKAAPVRPRKAGSERST